MLHTERILQEMEGSTKYEMRGEVAVTMRAGLHQRELPRRR